MPDVLMIEPQQFPELPMIIAQVLLARLGGQVTVSNDEVKNSQQAYYGIRICWNLEMSEMILTLKTTDSLNDRPT